VVLEILLVLHTGLDVLKIRVQLAIGYSQKKGYNITIRVD